MSSLIDVRVKTITWEAPGVLSLTLVARDGSTLAAFDPGSHIDLHLPGGTVRQYSLCGDMNNVQSYRIAVREIEGGRATSLLHKDVRPGTVFPISEPRNNFALTPASQYLFIAGGIGITPLLPMMRAATASKSKWTLLYCVRNRESAIFLDEISSLDGEVAVFASEEGSRLDIAAHLSRIVPSALIYCCGPQRLMDAVADATAHWPPGSTRFEWFAARTRPEDEVSGGFEVVCARSGITLPVPPDSSILGVLLAAGIDIPRSCEQGVCGTCEARVLEGTVDHRDSILSAAEQAANETMMTCVSRSLGPRLVLDI